MDDIEDKIKGAKAIFSAHPIQTKDYTTGDRCDRLARLAQRLFGVSLAFLHIPGKNLLWIKCSYEWSTTDVTREIEFCEQALDKKVLYVPDIKDSSFANHACANIEPKIMGFACSPITSSEKKRIGVFGLVNKKVMNLSKIELQYFSKLTSLVETFYREPKDEAKLNEGQDTATLFFSEVLQFVTSFSKDMGWHLGLMIIQIVSKNPGAAPEDSEFVTEINKLVIDSIRGSDMMGRVDTGSIYIFFPKCGIAGVDLVKNRIREHAKTVQKHFDPKGNFILKFRQFSWSPEKIEKVSNLIDKTSVLLEELSEEIA